MYWYSPSLIAEKSMIIVTILYIHAAIIIIGMVLCLDKTLLYCLCQNLFTMYTYFYDRIIDDLDKSVSIINWFY